MSNSAGFSEKPAIFVSGNDVYVVWDDDTSGNAEILYRKSTDGGATFGSTVNLSNDAGTSRAPALVVSGNNVYVVWSDDTVGNFEIYYRKSIDGGASFGSTVNLSNNGADSGSPAVDVSGNNIYVVWDDFTPGSTDIFYRKSTDDGVSFGSTVNLSNSIGGSFTPAIAVSGNNVHVAWFDSTFANTDVLYRKSTDRGATFGSTVNLSNDAGSSESPSIDISGSTVYVVWLDNTPGNFEILLRKSVNAGAAFGSTINVSQNDGSSGLPAIAVSPNNF